jgi:hypothetical protein
MVDGHKSCANIGEWFSVPLLSPGAESLRISHCALAPSLRLLLPWVGPSPRSGPRSRAADFPRRGFAGAGSSTGMLSRRGGRRCCETSACGRRRMTRRMRKWNVCVPTTGGCAKDSTKHGGSSSRSERRSNLSWCPRSASRKRSTLWLKRVAQSGTLSSSSPSRQRSATDVARPPLADGIPRRPDGCCRGTGDRCGGAPCAHGTRRRGCRGDINAHHCRGNGHPRTGYPPSVPRRRSASRRSRERVQPP